MTALTYGWEVSAVCEPEPAVEIVQQQLMQLQGKRTQSSGCTTSAKDVASGCCTSLLARISHGGLLAAQVLAIRYMRLARGCDAQFEFFTTI
jgi:hypothetical protein